MLQDLRCYDSIVKTKKGLKKYLSKFFSQTFNLFKNDGYIPENLNDANYYLKNNIFQLEKQQDLLGVYVENGIEKSIEISQQNYFCGYYYKIWENLSIKDRAQIIYWHVKSKQETVQTKIDFRMLPDEGFANYYEADGGFSTEKDQKIFYINIEKVFDKNPFNLIFTIEHEFEHVKQKFHFNYLQRKHIKPSSIYDFMCYWDPKYLEVILKPDYINYALYATQHTEITADKRGIKNLLKLFENNKKHYGLYDATQQEMIKKYLISLKAEKGLLSPKEIDTYISNESDRVALKEIEFFRKNEEFLNKLCIIKSYHLHNKNDIEIQKCNEILKNFIEKHEKDEEYIDSVWETMPTKTKNINKDEENCK